MWNGRRMKASMGANIWDSKRRSSEEKMVFPKRKKQVLIDQSKEEPASETCLPCRNRKGKNSWDNQAGLAVTIISG